MHMFRYLWLATTVVILVLGGAVLVTRGGRIQPLDQLPGGISGPTVEGITDTAARIVLRTGEPAFCQVSYGPTSHYGQMRRMDMSGPMTDHRIVLPGLHPGTEYHFKLSAINGDARVYQSADLTFTTLQSTSSPPVGTNVASVKVGARVIGVSSNYGGGGNDGTFGATHAIDGDPNTEWSSDRDGNNAWIEIELAKTFRITAIGFWTRTMGTSAQIQEFEVIADGTTRLGPFILSDASGIRYFPVDVMARRLRFNVVRSSGGNTGAVEIQAIANP